MGALIGGRSGKERLTWLGGWLMFGAFVALALVGFVFIAGTRAIAAASITASGALTQATIEALRSLGAVVVQQFVLRALIPAALLLLLSVGLIGLGWARKGR
jgi:hypothetical protein